MWFIFSELTFWGEDRHSTNTFRYLVTSVISGITEQGAITGVVLKVSSVSR